jgi:hypothetical protein
MKLFRCRICLRHFDVIPEDAVEIPVGSGRGHAYRMFRFTDGSIHDLRAKVVPDPPPPPEQLPQVVSKPQPKEIVAQVGSTRAPQVEEVPLIIGDGVTAMRAAFEKLFRQEQQDEYVDGDSIEKF